MKVLQIAERQRKKDGKPYWTCALEGEARPLLMFQKPTFSEGTDIPDDSLQLKGQGENQYFSIDTPRTAAKPESPKSARSPEERASIERQSTLAQAVQLYNNSVGSPAPYDPKQLAKIFHDMLKLVQPNLVEEAKRLGAVEP